MPQIDWSAFIRRYRRRDAHWYVSKIKTYERESLDQLSQGLALLNKWFVDPRSSLTIAEIEHLRSFVGPFQAPLMPPAGDLLHPGLFRWAPKTELYFAWVLHHHGLISELNRPQSVLELYRKVFEAIEADLNYDELQQVYYQRLLSDIAANARNFVSWFKKLGLAWVTGGKAVTISSTGHKFIEPSGDLRVIIEKQLRKWQIYNPALPRRRYEHMRVFPYVATLRILLSIDPPQISKREYALFVTKIESMDQVERAVEEITAWRELTDDNKKTIEDKLARRQSHRARSLWAENLDSASKEIGFLGLAGPCERARVNRALGLALVDRERAREILELVGPSLVFIDFENEADWFNYFGDWDKGPTVDDAVAYYAQIGLIQRADELASTPQASEQARQIAQSAVTEKEIEEFYLQRLGLIEAGLYLFREPGRDGHQYPTEIGRIDILAQDAQDHFVVLEFKRAQGSDETVGQLLRYMGWVYRNLAAEERVRGIIIAGEFDDKTVYAIIGTQHPQRREIFSLHRHGYGGERVTINRMERFE